VNRLAIAVMASALLATPALAQQNQGGGNLGNMLEDIGRSLNGQSNPPQQNYQNTYQQTYNESQRQYRNESDQQLQQDEQRLSAAWNRLRAASQALDQEMSRRGMRTGSNQNYNGPNGGNYSGSSTYRGGYDNGQPPYQRYNGQNEQYNGR